MAGIGKAKQRCSVCGASLTLCMCVEVPRLDLRTKVALVIHHRELSRSSNTGLLALQSLVNSEVRIRGESREALDVGIRGVPFFIFDGKIAVSGAQDPAALLEAISAARQPS